MFDNIGVAMLTCQGDRLCREPPHERVSDRSSTRSHGLDRGTFVAVQYAIVRDDPSRDDYLRHLRRLLQSVKAAKVISGVGD
ncbi:hypothetical protein [Paraburkholderia hospita]|uniref:hypothetical protein n=1 Tax=Paraburkholderia hospita TaxID=169430 RepID=UPI0011787855